MADSSPYTGEPLGALNFREHEAELGQQICLKLNEKDLFSVSEKY